MDKSDILVIPNFLREEECDDILTKFHQVEFARTESNEFWDGRVKFFHSPETVFHKMTTVQKKLLESYFGVYVRRQIDINYVNWPAGFEMPPHNDLGSNNEFPNRHYTSIVYLTNEFTGGEIHFPSLDYEIKPEKGMLVMFKGNELFHGVRKVMSGNRITSICWWEIV